MTKILRFTTKTPSRFGFQRVKKRTKSDSERKDQLNLFSSLSGRILQFRSQDLTSFDEALLLDERGDGKAEEVYWKAISEGDSVADAYCNLGILEFHAGRTAKAFDCLTNSLKYDPRHLESHYNLGNLYFEVGDLKLAHVHYQMAIEIDPAFLNAHFNIGLIHALNQDFQAAFESLTRYKELAPAAEGVKADEILASLRQTLTRRK